jgi:iron complex outermembrane receptor protein
MLKWKPIESLLLRGTVADGFRAPTIADLYGGTSDTFSFYTDPCDVVFGLSTPGSQTRANCASGVGGAGAALGGLAPTFRQLGQGFVPVGAPNAQTPVAFRSGSNPNLTPEISKSQTIGFVWSPSFIEGFNIAADWWKIRIKDTIVADSPQQILTDCYVQGIASRCSPTLFTRDPAQGYINFLSFGGRNAGYRKTEGFDFDVSYRLRTENWGNFAITSNSTYTVRDITVATNDPRYPLSSTGFANFFRLRSNANLTWDKGPFGFSWSARYYSGMKEGCTYFIPGTTGAALEPNLECNEIQFAPTGAFVTGTNTPASALTRRRVVGSNTFHDMQFRVQAPWNATIAIGANNIFDHTGPVMYTQPSANVSYYGGFDIGRFWYMRYTQRF